MRYVHLSESSLQPGTGSETSFLPDPGRRLSFHLAMEEYVARHVVGDSGDDAFFMWRVRPSVIIGRNQDMDAEVDRAYCRANAIDLYQRKSGGGCVYADQGNLMLSYVTRDPQSPLAMKRLLDMIVLVLKRAGVDALTTSHNDVHIGGRKVSGSACYRLPAHNIAHSTLLYEVDSEKLEHAITPPPSKLKRKGVESVRQRVTMLREHTQMPLEELCRLFATTLCNDSCTLAESDIKAIEQIEQDYFDRGLVCLMH